MRRTGSGVRPVIDGHELVGRHMGVFLGCGERGMTQEFLDGSEVRSLIEEVCSKGMAQGVRSDNFVETVFGLFLHHAFHASSGQASSSSI